MAQHTAHLLDVRKLMGLMLGPNIIIAKVIKRCTYCYYVRGATLINRVGGMPWPQTGDTQYHTQLGLPDKGQAIKGLVVCYEWDLEPAEQFVPRLSLGPYPCRVLTFLGSPNLCLT